MFTVKILKGGRPIKEGKINQKEKRVFKILMNSLVRILKITMMKKKIVSLLKKIKIKKIKGLKIRMKMKKNFKI
jgi:hypothetical protein